MIFGKKRKRIEILMLEKLDFAGAEERKLYELNAEERRAEERKHLIRIHKLYREDFLEYLKQKQKFTDYFGKNIECDVCGNWDDDLFHHRGQTYCEKHIPCSIQKENERKIIAGRHGASRDFIKK
jgi:hypothetical protein